MKKILMTLAIATILLTGCGKKVELDLNKIKDEMQNLKGEKFSYDGALELLNSEYDKYEDIYDLEELGLTYEETEQVLYKKNGEDKIIIIKPMLEYKDDIKGKMDELFKDEKNLTFEEIEDYLFYVVSEDSDEIIKKFKNVRGQVFSTLVEINKADMETMMDIKESWIDESLVTSPALIVNANLYMVVKPSKGHEKDVKDALDAYMVKKEEEWKLYLPDQYELFKNRKYEKYGDYLIYIVSNDNNKVLDTIKASEK